jgi:galactokinase
LRLAVDQEAIQLRASRAFARTYGRAPQWVALAPGRVNIIGEHTDYNDGFVLPMTIERYTSVVAAPRAASPGEGDNARRLRVHSSEMAETVDVPLDRRVARGASPWANYVRGVLHGLEERGARIPSLDMSIVSDVPLGGGLSSSAALEVATAALLELASGTALTPLERALLCQKAEHQFAGVPCGLMDQLVVTLGDERGPLLIDCRSREARVVPFLDKEMVVLVSNTNVKHTLVDGAYAQRREECASAARVLGIASLRDATTHAIEAREKALGPTLYRRARHVVTENARTLAAAAALETGRLDGLGPLLYESHRSLKEDYEVSCVELDIVVDAARALGETAGVLGARMTGGGFGGCTVTLVRAREADSVARALRHQYESRTGRSLDTFVTRPARGVHSFDARSAP